MDTRGELTRYTYRGARTLVLLHERELRHFLEVWRQAKADRVVLPATDDPDYQSLDHLLHHVLRAARGYMTWMCEKLELPDPGIESAPAAENIEREAERTLEQLLEKWREPLAAVEEERFHRPCYTSRWGVDYCLDAMLEHAVAHPMRHAFQLEEMLERGR
jgi:uncharacterized damage-inducible protein DinB